MKLRSDSFDHGQPIPQDYAFGARDGLGGNRNPHLAWDDVPEGTRSFALLCIDPDAPSDASLAGKEGVTIPVEHVRADFVHWAVVDIPADLREVAAGSASNAPLAGGKAADATGGLGRQGLNDYTGWFAGSADMRGDYFGYDGPYPPPNDARMHRYFFRLYALDVPSLPVDGRFSAAEVLAAMHGHVLAEATTYGTYSLFDG